jgi:hypothetical protein
VGLPTSLMSIPARCRESNTLSSSPREASIGGTAAGGRRSSAIKVVVPTPMPSIGPVPECLNRPSRQECADRFPEKFFLNGGDLAVGIKSQRKDWTGQRFGRLVAVSFVGRRRHNAVWLFRCDCGSEHGASISNVARQDRPIRSCGCLYCEVTGTRAPYAVTTPRLRSLRAD